METHFILMRHARTEWNQQRRIQGQTDTPLALEGIDMARNWGASPELRDIDLILTSDMLRARQTSELVNERLDVPVLEDARLREQHWGDWTGLYVADLRAMRDTVRALENQGYGFRPPNGEDRQQVFDRAAEALHDAAKAHAGKRILVTTHNGVLRVLAYKLLGMDFIPDEKRPISKDYRLHHLVCADGELAVRQLNLEF
ncbi:histidine phosphatase family protein [Salidesulfovibrio onnuriiensis]|uniref:histidine phosphatase family protein n=1 Tax=Salidesulfovibrio onnuriiensis TaxID=2583823 RepID=UPI0011C8418B|nr:histidine phosphatase family protein [Salidesulfovibrio onnuriiensis]